jgi:hypothetical protein
MCSRGTENVNNCWVCTGFRQADVNVYVSYVPIDFSRKSSKEDFEISRSGTQGGWKIGNSKGMEKMTWWRNSQLSLFANHYNDDRLMEDKDRQKM